jgi:hypothetical protein
MSSLPSALRARAGWLVLCALLACERAAPVVVGLPQDAALAPVVLVPAQEPGISAFDCTGTEPGQSTQSLRAWKAAGAAGAATNLKGHALACDLTLRSDCAGQAELRVSAGLARSEKVVTAVSVGKPVSVSLRLTDEAWEKALEPVEGRPYQYTLQLVARAEVSCAAPIAEPRPRYWTDSFIAGLMGPKAKPVANDPSEPDVAVSDAPAGGEGGEEREGELEPTRAPAPTTPRASATTSTASERARERAAKSERKKKTTPTVDLNLHPPGAQPPSVADEEPATHE